MDAETRVKLHIGELIVSLHALQAQVEDLQAKVKQDAAVEAAKEAAEKPLP